MDNKNIFNFPLLYSWVNMYTGESRWLSMEDGNQLKEKDDYWECDEQQKPIPIYPDSWIPEDF